MNVNDINTSIERHTLAEWIKKKSPDYTVYKKPISDVGYRKIKCKKMKKNIYYTNINQSKVRNILIVFDKVGDTLRQHSSSKCV